MTKERKAARLGGFAVLLLVGGCLLALFAPRFQAGIVAVAFASYVACTRSALMLYRADDLVFERRLMGEREEAARNALRAGLVAGSAGALSIGRSLNEKPRALRSRREPRSWPTFPHPLKGTR